MFLPARDAGHRPVRIEGSFLSPAERLPEHRPRVDPDGPARAGAADGRRDGRPRGDRLFGPRRARSQQDLPLRRSRRVRAGRRQVQLLGHRYRAPRPHRAAAQRRSGRLGVQLPDLPERSDRFGLQSPDEEPSGQRNPHGPRRDSAPAVAAKDRQPPSAPRRRREPQRS